MAMPAASLLAGTAVVVMDASSSTVTAILGDLISTKARHRARAKQLNEETSTVWQ
jgi:hypothetical protein